MELRHVRYFTVLARLKSFSRAAETLRITQPTLSHQIKQFEGELGVALFDRLPRRIELTMSGHMLLPYCERMLQEESAAFQALSQLRGLLSGDLRMGIFHSLPRSLISSVISDFVTRFNNVRVVARLLPKSQMECDLVEGRLDLAVAYTPSDTEHIVAEHLYREELVLAVSREHPLAGRRSLPMGALPQHRLVLLTTDFASRQYIDCHFRGAGLKLDIALEMNEIDQIFAVIRKIPLATVLPAGSISKSSGLSIVHLKDPTPERWVALLWRRQTQLSAPAAKMAEMIRSAYQLDRD